MRTDLIGPRTWLLASVAGWAVLVWLLALFGLGGQIRPLPADPSLIAALPQLPKQPPERLGPLSQYSEIAARPLLSESRTPQPFVISGQEGEQAPTFDFVLSSVMITPRLQLAILQSSQGGGEGVRVKLGEAPTSAPGWRMVELNARSAVFDGPEGPRTLELRVFDGAGGQAPTASSVRPGMSGGMPIAPPGPNSGSPNGGSPNNGSPNSGRGGAPGARTAQSVPSDSGSPDDVSPQTESPLTTEQQMDAIRKRIEARRAQLRQQAESASPSNNNK